MPCPLVVFCRSLAHLTRFRYVSYVTFAADRAVLPAVTKALAKTTETPALTSETSQVTANPM